MKLEGARGRKVTGSLHFWVGCGQWAVSRPELGVFGRVLWLVGASGPSFAGPESFLSRQASPLVGGTVHVGLGYRGCCMNAPVVAESGSVLHNRAEFRILPPLGGCIGAGSAAITPRITGKLIRATPSIGHLVVIQLE